MKSGSKRPMIGPWPCTYACAYINPVFTSQSYDISISTSRRRMNFSVFFVLMLMLISTQFSLAYTCACACAYVYAYALVKTRLKISKFRVNTTSRWVIKQLRISFGSISPLLYMKLAGEHIHSSQGNTLSLLWCAAKWSFALYDC